MQRRTVVERVTAMVRRRGLLLLGAGTAVAIACAFALTVLPDRHTARAIVAPASGRYEGPLGLLATRTRAPAVLDGIALEAGVSPQRDLGEWLACDPLSPGERLGARIEPTPASGPVEHVVITVETTSPTSALRAAELIALALVNHDAKDAGAAAPLSSASAPVANAPVLRERLEQLRATHPLLRDPALTARVQTIAAGVSEDEMALASLRAQALGTIDEAERLELLVKAEAGNALRLHREDEAAQQRALAARSAAAATPARAEPAAPSPVAAAPLSRVAELEAELARLLSSRTQRHPDVRRVQRLLESERARAPLPRPASEPASTSPDRQVADVAELAPMTLAAADEPGAPAGVAAAEAPPEWLQRAPSYGRWIDARARESAARLALEARAQEASARKREHDRLVTEQRELVTPRVEEARLVAALEVESRDAPARAASRGAPLRVYEAPMIVGVSTSWDAAPGMAALAALLVLLLAVAVDLQDRTVRTREDVEDELGVPVLATLPHLRRGRA